MASLWLGRPRASRGAPTRHDVIMANLAAAYPDSNQDRQASLTLTDDVRLPPQWAGPIDIVSTGLMLVVGVAAAAHVGPARRVLRLDLMQALHVD